MFKTLINLHPKVLNNVTAKNTIGTVCCNYNEDERMRH